MSVSLTCIAVSPPSHVKRFCGYCALTAAGASTGAYRPVSTAGTACTVVVAVVVWLRYHVLSAASRAKPGNTVGIDVAGAVEE